MKIKRIIHKGNPRWRVNDPHGPGGKRQRKFFDNREAAERYAWQRKEDRAAFGIRFATIPPAERAMLGYQLSRLNALGWSLPAAVDFIERHGKALPASISLGKLADEFFTARQSAGLRPRYFQTLRASINRFLINRREKVIAGITPAEIQEYIACNGWKPSTMRSYLVDVRTLFAFAVKRKYLTENPALAVDLPRLEDKPPGILTPDQTRALLDACLDVSPDILPSVVLVLFGGLRRSEAEKIAWEEIGSEYIEISVCESSGTLTRQATRP